MSVCRLKRLLPRKQPISDIQPFSVLSNVLRLRIRLSEGGYGAIGWNSVAFISN